MANEDFTTYTEVDTGGTIGITSSTVTHTTTEIREDENYVAKDKGVDYFDGDFTHEIETAFTNNSGTAINNLWVLSSTLGDYQTCFAGSGLLYLLNTSTKFTIRQFPGGGAALDDTDNSIDPADGVIYYLTIIRNDTTNVITVYIRTGSHEGSLFDTITITVSDKEWRYIYAYQSYGPPGTGATFTGVSQNFNLNEVVADGLIQGIMSYNGMHQVILRGVILG